LLHQFSHPRGALGRWAGRRFNVANAGINQAAIDHLGIKPADAVLEVGFGGGVSLVPLLQAVTRQGKVAAIEVSHDMLDGARARLRSDVLEGRLELVAASVAALPWPAATFDAAMSVNTLYFWPDVPAGLAELRSVLKPSAPLCVGSRPAELQRQAGWQALGYRVIAPDEVATALRTAGFEGVATHRHGKVDVLTTGRAPAA